MATNAPVRAVVFDLGGVVLGSPLEGIAEYEKAHGVPLGFVNVSIVAKGRQGAFQRLERGELGMKDFYAEFRSELGAESNIPAYVRYLQKKGRAVPSNLPKSIDIDTVELFRCMMEKAAAISGDMCHALFVLRGRGLKVAALTNNWQLTDDGAAAGPKDSSSTNLLRAFFDDIIESSIVGLRKPDPRLYQLTCDRLGVQADQVVFLDDIGLNLRAARSLGWRTIKVEIGKTRQALQSLAEALGFAPSELVPDPATFASSPVTLRYPVGADGGVLVADVYGYATCPIVVLLHGGGQTRHSWAATATSLAREGFCAVTVDMKGHGESYWDSRKGLTEYERYGWSHFGVDLDALVLAMRLADHPAGFALVGASLGGLALLSSQHARRTARALVLVDISPRMELSGVERIVGWMKATSKSGFRTLQEAAEAVAAYKAGGAPLDAAAPGPASQSSLDGLRKNLRKNEQGMWVWHWDPQFLTEHLPSQSQLEETETNLYANAADTQAPCLLVRGRQTDLVSPQAALSFVERMPNARFVDVENATHMVVGDRNDVFTAETLSFLRQYLVAAKPTESGLAPPLQASHLPKVGSASPASASRL